MMDPRGGKRIGWLGALALLVALAMPPVLARPGVIRIYTEEAGLRSSWVAAVQQGPDGRMWFLTRSGISIYDGTEWHPSDLDSGGALLDGFGLSLLPDSTGWAVTTGGSLVRYDGRSWSRVTGNFIPPKTNPITAFAVAGTAGARVPALGTSGLGLFIYVDGEMVSLLRSGELPDRHVHALLARDDELLIGTETGLWSWQRGRRARRVALPNVSFPVRGLALDASRPADGRPAREDRVWIAGRDWIGMLGTESFEILERFAAHAVLEPHPRLLMAADANGGLYFGNEGALFYLAEHRGRLNWATRADGLVGEGALALHRDREGNMWIGTGIGLFKVANTPFQNFDKAAGLLEDGVFAVSELGSGDIALGQSTGVTFYRDGAFRKLKISPAHERSELVGRILDMEPDDDGNLWLAMMGWGLARVSPNGDVHWPYSAHEAHDWVFSVRLDHEGRLWVARSEGIYRLDAGKLVQVDAPGLAPYGTRRIFRGNDGAMYFATDGGGLLRHERGRWSRIISEGSAASNSVYALLEDHAGRVLVGTYAGLMVVDRGKLRRPTETGVPRIERPVYFLVEDAERRLWIGTDRGAFRWNSGGELRHFTTRQGLAGLETSRAAGFTDSQGRVWLGTDRGVSVYDERWVPRDPAAPVVELLAAEARGEAFAPSEPTELSHSRNDLAFVLRAISFIDESRLVFRTKLEGLDDDWATHASSTRLVVRYPRLPARTYRLMTQARNPLGGWGPVTGSAEIVVTRPFWLRGWFLLVAGVAVVLCVVGLNSFLYHRRDARALRTEVQRRTLELEEARRDALSEKERLVAILGSVGDGVLAVDPDNRLILANPAARRMLAIDAEPVSELILDEALAAHGEPIAGQVRDLVDQARRPATGDPRRVVVSVDGEGGGCLEVAAAAYFPARWSRAGVVLALRDISERRRFEEEQARRRRLEALGILAGGIAHDFNNILTSVLGNISMLQVEARPGSAEERRLGEAEKAVERAHRLARRLVTFARGGAPVTGPASLGKLLAESSRFVFSGSAVKHALHLPEDLWPAEVDTDQILQVFENLLLNARQAMSHRGNVEIRAFNLDARGAGCPPYLEQGRYVRIDVSDDGEGIPAESLDRVFEPYFTTKSEGSGLGLATSYSIVKRHGGHLTATSTVGEGTTFSVILPASELQPAQRPTSLPAAGPGDRAALRILLLEDEPLVADVLRQMLDHLGHEVVHTVDGDESLEACEEAVGRGRPFDVAILDLTVPGGRGAMEILPRLRSLDRGMQLIASSGYSDRDVLSRYAEKGFAAALPKPYTMEELAAVLRKLGRKTAT